MENQEQVQKKRAEGTFLSSVLYAEATGDVKIKVDEELKIVEDPAGAAQLIQENTIESTKGV